MIDTNIEHYYLLKPNQFPIVERLEVYQPIGDEIITNLNLTLRASNDTNSERLLVSFLDVRDLEFQPFVQPLQFLILRISSLQDRQWERVNYQVHNAEQDVSFSFLCFGFKATLNRGSHTNIDEHL